MRYPVLALLALSATATPAYGVSCGDVITSNTVLTADIGPCDSGTDPAITVVGPATLDMNGKTLLCDDADPPSTGLLMEGKGAKLENGVVRNCGEFLGNASVSLEGDGSHKVTNVLSAGGSRGFLVESPKARLKGAAASDNLREGFFVSSAAVGALLDGCSAVSNGFDGFTIRGAGARLKRVAAVDNGGGGVLAGTSGVKVDQSLAKSNLTFGFGTTSASIGFALTKNRAFDNSLGGFVVQGAGKFIGNVGFSDASGDPNFAGDILVDPAACGGILFKKNVFGFANDPCVE